MDDVRKTQTTPPLEAHEGIETTRANNVGCLWGIWRGRRTIVCKGPHEALTITRREWQILALGLLIKNACEEVR